MNAFDKNIFSSFIGLNYGDTVDKALSIFGQPDDSFTRDEHHYSVYYYMVDNEDVMSVAFDKTDKVIESIYLGCESLSFVLDWIDNFAPDDEKTSFINMHIDKIIEILDTPYEINGDDYIFKTDKTEIIFHCPENNDYYCQKIFLYWYF